MRTGSARVIGLVMAAMIPAFTAAGQTTALEPTVDGIPAPRVHEIECAGPPSQNYLDVDTMAVFTYDNSTCLLTPTGLTAPNYAGYLCMDIFDSDYTIRSDMKEHCLGSTLCNSPGTFTFCDSARLAVVNPCYRAPPGFCSRTLEFEWKVEFLGANGGWYCDAPGYCPPSREFTFNEQYPPVLFLDGPPELWDTHGLSQSGDPCRFRATGTLWWNGQEADSDEWTAWVCP